MGDKKIQKEKGKPVPTFNNDQIGENAGEGRMSRELRPKGKK